MVIWAVSVEGEDGGMEEIQGCGGGPGIAWGILVISDVGCSWISG